MTLTVVVPTFNEAPSIDELVRRVAVATSPSGLDAEILLVDDSSDATPGSITAAAALGLIPARLIHREHPVGSLSGAALTGLEASTSNSCLVMDGDLQHPPEMIPVLLKAGVTSGADLVVASRYVRGESSRGLGNRLRHLVSNASSVLTRAMFPRKLRDCTDPMTGFFAVRRASIDLTLLRPCGFKILAREHLTVVEEPLLFAERTAGSSKASMRQGFSFLARLASLRFGRLSAFAHIGALGAVANLRIMGGLQLAGVWYLAAAITAAIITIVGNFMLQERFVFHDLRAEGRSVRVRFGQSVAFNGAETAVRTTLLFLIVEATVPSLFVQAVLITVGFTVRFVYHSRIVYRAARTTKVSPLLGADLDAQADEEATA